jgi:hypothetical protein
MPTHFSPEALKFLRGLKRNNNRKAVYEREIKAPMRGVLRSSRYSRHPATAPEDTSPTHTNRKRSNLPASAASQRGTSHTHESSGKRPPASSPSSHTRIADTSTATEERLQSPSFLCPTMQL